jgi:H+-translocating NAD(P) transhydrogenase subunit alpha
VLLHMVRDGALTVDLADDIQAGVVITHDGKVVQQATAALLRPTSDGEPDVDGTGN